MRSRQWSPQGSHSQKGCPLADAPPQEVSITIDGVQRSVRHGELLIMAAQEAGTYIPRF